jgi:hypothetical protein
MRWPRFGGSVRPKNGAMHGARSKNREMYGARLSLALRRERERSSTNFWISTPFVSNYPSRSDCQKQNTLKLPMRFAEFSSTRFAQVTTFYGVRRRSPTNRNARSLGQAVRQR